MPRKQFTLVPGRCICQDAECDIPFGFCHCECGGKTEISKENKPPRRRIKGMPSVFIFGHGRRHKRVLPDDIDDPHVRRMGLTRGFYTVVDSADYDRLGGYTYRLTTWGYVKRHLPSGKSLSLHREIMGDPPGLVVDHINGNTLDNRRINLRVCTGEENSRNRKIDSRNKSGHIGLWWNQKKSRWDVFIGVDGKPKRLGSSKDKNVAIAIRKEGEKKYHGEFSPTCPR